MTGRLLNLPRLLLCLFLVSLTHFSAIAWPAIQNQSSAELLRKLTPNAIVHRYLLVNSKEVNLCCSFYPSLFSMLGSDLHMIGPYLWYLLETLPVLRRDLFLIFFQSERAFATCVELQPAPGLDLSHLGPFSVRRSSSLL